MSKRTKGGLGSMSPAPAHLSLHSVTHDPTCVVKAIGRLSRPRCCVARHRAAGVFTTPCLSTCQCENTACVRIVRCHIATFLPSAVDSDRASARRVVLQCHTVIAGLGASSQRLTCP